MPTFAGHLLTIAGCRKTFLVFRQTCYLWAMKVRLLAVVAQASLALVLAVGVARAEVKPGDLINKDNSAKVQNLVSPGNYILVQQGMQLNIVPTSKLDWPPPFKSATEKYSSQVVLNPDGTSEELCRGSAFPVARSQRPADGDQDNVEFQFPSALL